MNTMWNVVRVVLLVLVAGGCADGSDGAREESASAGYAGAPAPAPPRDQAQLDSITVTGSRLKADGGDGLVGQQYAEGSVLAY